VAVALAVQVVLEVLLVLILYLAQSHQLAVAVAEQMVYKMV
jgi:hypothetical protein